jgi:hypothetical protein
MSIDENMEKISKKIVDENTERFKQYISTDLNVAKALQQKTQNQAEQLSKDNADIADMLKQKTQNQADDIIKRMEQSADSIRNERITENETMTDSFKDMSRKMIDDMEEKSKVRSNNILQNISSVDTKLTEKIDSLGIKTDSANQNIIRIKKNILDMQTEVDGIYDVLNQRNLVHPNMYSSSSSSKKSRAGGASDTL